MIWICIFHNVPHIVIYRGYSPSEIVQNVHLLHIVSHTEVFSFRISLRSIVKKAVENMKDLEKQLTWGNMKHDSEALIHLQLCKFQWPTLRWYLLKNQIFDVELVGE